MKRFLLTLSLTLVTAAAVLAQGFPRCILAGDYADPSIMREGRDFYMTHSMFNYNPGFLIWHSQDLVNWEPVCRVATQQINDAWAPELLKHDGKYYLYFPSNKKVYVLNADKIEGPWSAPVVEEGKEGIDPALNPEARTWERNL